MRVRQLLDRPAPVQASVPAATASARRCARASALPSCACKSRLEEFPVEQVVAIDLGRLGDLPGHVTPEELWGIEAALLTGLGPDHQIRAISQNSDGVPSINQAHTCITETVLVCVRVEGLTRVRTTSWSPSVRVFLSTRMPSRTTSRVPRYRSGDRRG